MNADNPPRIIENPPNENPTPEKRDASNAEKMPGLLLSHRGIHVWHQQWKEYFWAPQRAVDVHRVFWVIGETAYAKEIEGSPILPPSVIGTLKVCIDRMLP